MTSGPNVQTATEPEPHTGCSDAVAGAATALRSPVSVVMATCNGAAFIAEQLASVISQLEAHDEVLIADDGSTDATLAVIRAQTDSRVRVLPLACAEPPEAGVPKRLGVVKNFERALQSARHDIIFLCDQDDVWLPGKVDACLAALQKCVLVVTDCRVVDVQLRALAPSFFAIQNSGPGLARNLWRNSFLGCCMAMRRSLLAVALPFPDQIAMHDMWLGLVAETQGGTRFLPQVLSLYRRHSTSVSTAAAPSNLPPHKRLAVRWHLSSALAVRLIKIRFLGVRAFAPGTPDGKNRA